jgi:threonine synthase
VYHKYKKATQDSRYTLIVSTASPYKFSEAVLSSLDEAVDLSLKANLTHLGQLDFKPVDSRLLDLFNQSVTKKVIDKDKALLKVVNHIEKMR